MHAAGGNTAEHQHLQLISATASAMCFMTANLLPICITHVHICTFGTHPSWHTQVRPYLMADGGNVEFVEIDGLIVKLKLAGACGSCPSSLTTMTMGIKRRLMEKIPVRLAVTTELCACSCTSSSRGSKDSSNKHSNGSTRHQRQASKYRSQQCGGETAAGAAGIEAVSAAGQQEQAQ